MRRSGTLMGAMLLAVLWPKLSSAVDYFPAGNNISFNYSLNGSMSLSSSGSTVWHSYSYMGGSNSWRYVIDSEGDVLESGCTIYASNCGAGACPGSFSIAPGALYLDFPLETGKTWSSETSVTYLSGEHYQMVLEGVVVGPSNVTVPAGNFDVIVVRITKRFPTAGWLNSTEVLWLHRQLGQVQDLVSWTGIVDTDGTAWGDLKAQFR